MQNLRPHPRRNQNPLHFNKISRWLVDPEESEKYSDSKYFSNLSVQKNYLESLLKIKIQFGQSGMGLGVCFFNKVPSWFWSRWSWDHPWGSTASCTWALASWAVDMITLTSISVRWGPWSERRDLQGELACQSAFSCSGWIGALALT